VPLNCGKYPSRIDMATLSGDGSLAYRRWRLPALDPRPTDNYDSCVVLGAMLRYHFQMKPTAFADELQKDWHLVSLTLHPRQTVIKVQTTVNHGVPSPVGRDGLSIMSYPAIHSERDQAEFVFQECLLVRVWDEAALSMRESNPNPRFEGRTFRRYTKSALLDLHTEPPITGIHYQLNFSNEIIDIICRIAPVVTLRRALFEEPIAG
jgi:hypothetical protein